MLWYKCIQLKITTTGLTLDFFVYSQLPFLPEASAANKYVFMGSKQKETIRKPTTANIMIILPLIAWKFLTRIITLLFSLYLMNCMLFNE